MNANSMRGTSFTAHKSVISHHSTLHSSFLFLSPDQPSIDVPEEIVSDENLELTCYAPDNCPDMTPEIQWMYTDFLPDPAFTTDLVEESNTAVLSNTLTFTPRPIHNGQLLGCRVFYPNTTLVYERLITLDIKCKYKIKASQPVLLQRGR